jgi:hypothetical protein
LRAAISLITQSNEAVTIRESVCLNLVPVQAALVKVSAKPLHPPPPNGFVLQKPRRRWGFFLLPSAGVGALTHCGYNDAPIFSLVGPPDMGEKCSYTFKRGGLGA